MISKTNYSEQERTVQLNGYPANKPNDQFLRFPANIIHCRELSNAGKVLWAEISRQQYGNRNDSFYRVDRMAEELGWSNKTVKRHLAELRGLGLLVRQSRGGRRASMSYLFQPFRGVGQKLSYSLILFNLLQNMQREEEGNWTREVGIDVLTQAERLTELDCKSWIDKLTKIQRRKEKSLEWAERNWKQDFRELGD